MNELFPGLILGVGRNSAWIALDGELEPRVAALKRMRGKREMPAPGDRVEARTLEDGSALIERMVPRESTLQRRTALGKSKTMAANVDTLVTVSSLAHPPPRLTTLDQLLVYAELENITPFVIFTKPDLAEPSIFSVPELYATLGYMTLTVNPKKGENVETLRKALSGHHAMLAGVSGVGKSSIFRALGGEAVVGDLSRAGLGKQTTSMARLYRLPSGFLIDSPGIAEFGLGALQPADLAEGFREMREPSRSCRFSDCTHTSEPGCAVRAAVDAGSIAQSRYDSYRRILEMCYTAPRA